MVPFYFEIRETDRWILDFARDFLLSFIWQYIAFHSRKPEYMEHIEYDFSKAVRSAKDEKLDYLISTIKSAWKAFEREDDDLLWEIAREAPRGGCLSTMMSGLPAVARAGLSD